MPFSSNFNILQASVVCHFYQIVKFCKHLWLAYLMKLNVLVQKDSVICEDDYVWLGCLVLINWYKQIIIPFYLILNYDYLWSHHNLLVHFYLLFLVGGGKSLNFLTFSTFAWIRLETGGLEWGALLSHTCKLVGKSNKLWSS